MAIWSWKNLTKRIAPAKSDQELQDDWMKDQYEKNRKHIENQPELKTKDWRVIKTDIHDLGAKK
jgi:hypothetical protein